MQYSTTTNHPDNLAVNCLDRPVIISFVSCERDGTYTVHNGTREKQTSRGRRGGAPRGYVFDGSFGKRHHGT